jgi:DNA polymerase
LLIGEGPGTEERDKDCFFVGLAGEKLDKTLTLTGLSLDKDFLSYNLVRCWPAPPASSKRFNGTPTAAQISKCRKHLDKLVERFNPKLIVLCGGLAAKHVLLNFGSNVSSIVGKFFSSRHHNLSSSADVYICWHPSYILRAPENEKDWFFQLIKCRDFMVSRRLV